MAYICYVVSDLMGKYEFILAALCVFLLISAFYLQNLYFSVLATDIDVAELGTYPFLCLYLLLFVAFLNYYFVFILTDPLFLLLLPATVCLHVSIVDRMFVVFGVENTCARLALFTFLLLLAIFKFGLNTEGLEL
jgi:hypothetical protein